MERTSGISAFLMGHTFFEGPYLVHAHAMTAFLEFGGEPNFHEIDGSLMIDGARPQAEHVGIIVRPAHARGELVDGQGGPNPWKLIGGNAHSHARAADEDAPVGAGIGNFGSHDVGIVRVVHGPDGISGHSVIQHGVVGEREEVDDETLKFFPRVIGGDGNFHKQFLEARVNATTISNES